MPDKAYDLVVVGTGTGTAASVTAFGCRKAGWSVAIVDHRPYGGTCALRQRGTVAAPRLPFRTPLLDAMVEKVGDEHAAVVSAQLKGWGRLTNHVFGQRRRLFLCEACSG